MAWLGGENACMSPLRAAAWLVGCALSWIPAAALGQSITYFEIDPLVVDLGGSRDVDIVFHIDGAPDQVVLQPTTSPPRQLASSGSGAYPATLTHAEAVAGYNGAEAYNHNNHNHVGWLKLFKGGVQQASFNLFVEILDDAIAPVAVTDLSRDARMSPHVLALELPRLDPADPSLSVITQRAYEILGDDYEFLNVIHLPQRPANREHVPISNDVLGIGMEVKDAGAAYGSAGTLKGITTFPLLAYFDAGSSSLVHELGHAWMNWLDIPDKLQGAKFHWPLSTLAQSVMGLSGTAASGYQGEALPCALVALSGGDHQCNAAPPWTAFNDVDLYLMGFLPAGQVGPHQVFLDQSQVPTPGGVLHGPTVLFTVQDIVAAYGARLPAYPDAPRVFSIATVVASRDGLPSDAEMAVLDHFAARAAATSPLPYSEGLSAGTALPFGPATGGRGCLIATLRFHAPALTAPATAATGTGYTVSWTGANPGGAYEVQESTSPAFAAATAKLVDATSAGYAHQVGAAAVTYHYRVRAVDGCGGVTRTSAWSPTVAVTVVPGGSQVRRRLSSGG